MLTFNNCGVFISGQPILADNISISERSNFTPIIHGGFSNIKMVSPINQTEQTIQIDYLLETNDINHKLINQIRNYDFSSVPVSISVAGLTNNGYPTSFSLEILPNDTIKASISYICYSGFIGNLTSQSTTAYTGFNVLNSSGIGHYWTTYFKNNSSTGSVIQGNYNLSLNWKPLFKVNQTAPFAVKFLNGEESFNFLSEYESRINYTGEDFSSKFTDFKVIEINPISDTVGITGSKITLYPESGRINENRININSQNFILNETNIIKYY